MSLPWWIARGDLVRTAIPLGFVLVGAGLPWLAALTRWRWRASRIRRARGRSGDAPSATGTRAALVGRLRVRGAACSRFEDGQPAASAVAALVPRRGPREVVRARAETLWLEADPSVELTGPVDVRVGSRERASWRRLRRLGVAVIHRITGAGGSAPLSARVTFRSVGDGDRVWVAGDLCRGSSPAPDPDAPDGPLHLVPSPTESPAQEPAIVLVATGAPRAGASRWIALLAGAALGLLAWVAADAGLGVGAMRQERYSWALLTTRHQQARSHLLYQLLAELPQRPQVERAVELAELGGHLGEIHAVIEALLASGRRREAEALIARHPNRDFLERLHDEGDHARIEQLALDLGDAPALTGVRLSEGRFEAASGVLEAHPSGGGGVYSDPRDAVLVHLLAGRLAAALAEFDESRHPVPWHRGERYLQPALRSRVARDRDSLEELRAAAMPERAPDRLGTPCPGCAVGESIGSLLLADLLADGEALEVLDYCRDCERQYPRATWLLRYRSAACVAPTTGPAQARCHRLTTTAPQVFGDSRWFGPKTVTSYGLSAPILAALEARDELDPERRLVRAILSEDRAALDGATGEIDAALRRLARARADWAVLDQQLADRWTPEQQLDLPAFNKLERLALRVDPGAHLRATILAELRLALAAGQADRARALSTVAAESCPRLAVELADPFCREVVRLHELERLRDPSTYLAPGAVLALVTEELPQHAGLDGLEAALWTGDARSLDDRWPPEVLALVGRSVTRNSESARADLSRALWQSAEAGAIAFSFDLAMRAAPAFAALGDAERAARTRAALAAYRRAWLRPETSLALLAGE
ncbi:MAG: hypothetical protein JW751_16130 [Polyangiaceae bacterium]|nr:hypothetical protein [Polyangiaceae bacterium]